MDWFLLYASKSRLTFPGAAAEVHKIIESSQARNATLGVTGVLIATRREFAQILEGTQPAIEHLMRRITADPRHEDVRVLTNVLIDRRRFPRWTMAYSGPATYVAGRVEKLLPGGGGCDDAHVAELVRLMEAFGDAEP